MDKSIYKSIQALADNLTKLPRSEESLTDWIIIATDGGNDLFSAARGSYFDVIAMLCTFFDHLLEKAPAGMPTTKKEFMTMLTTIYTGGDADDPISR